MKKKLFILVLSLTMILTFSGCDKAKKAVAEATEKITITPTETVVPTEAPVEEDVTPTPTTEEAEEVTPVPTTEDVTPIPTEEAEITIAPTESATLSKEATKVPTTAGTTKAPTVGATKTPTKATSTAPTKSATKAPTKTATKAPTSKPNHTHEYQLVFKRKTTTYQELVSYAYTEEIPIGRDYIFCNKCDQRFDHVDQWRKHSDDIFESTGDFHGSYRIEWVQTGKNIIEHPAVYETKTKTEEYAYKLWCPTCKTVFWYDGCGKSLEQWEADNNFGYVDSFITID